MKILITGSKGFIGKNLIAELRTFDKFILFEYDIDSSLTELEFYCKEADFVFHLAGVNRPLDEAEFIKGNYDFTSLLLDRLRKFGNKCPLVISSSTQATLPNSYGKSKLAGESLVRDYGRSTGAKIMIYRFTNVFGKWCRPNYNSAVATFCHNIARGIPVSVSDVGKEMWLVYIDDVVRELVRALGNEPNLKGDFCEVPISHCVTLGEIVSLLESFKSSRSDLLIPEQSEDFTRKLYSTYLSYIPVDNFIYDLKMNVDVRGSFTEFIKSPDRGQVSINISKPGIVKGNHWHHSKNEKFLVVAGSGVIRFRMLESDEIIEYFVSGEKLQVVDVPVGFTHNIENLGESDMVTVMWVNEIFDASAPDTYFLEV